MWLINRSPVRYSDREHIRSSSNSSTKKQLPFLITLMVVKCYSHVIIPLNRIGLDRNSILQYYLLLVLEDLRNAVKMMMRIGYG